MLRVAPKTQSEKEKTQKIIEKAEKAGRKAEPKIVVRGNRSGGRPKMDPAERAERKELAAMLKRAEKAKRQQNLVEIVEMPATAAPMGMVDGVRGMALGILALPAGQIDGPQFTTNLRENSHIMDYVNNRLGLFGGAFSLLGDNGAFLCNYIYEFVRVKRILPAGNSLPIKQHDQQSTIPANNNGQQGPVITVAATTPSVGTGAASAIIDKLLRAKRVRATTDDRRDAGMQTANAVGEASVPPSSDVSV